jgi:hypothetical protein
MKKANYLKPRRAQTFLSVMHAIDPGGVYTSHWQHGGPFVGSTDNSRLSLAEMDRQRERAVARCIRGPLQPQEGPDGPEYR